MHLGEGGNLTAAFCVDILCMAFWIGPDKISFIFFLSELGPGLGIATLTKHKRAFGARVEFTVCSKLKTFFLYN